MNTADTVWVCEAGHVDDHHLDDPNPDNLCSRCGGTCEQFTLEAMARLIAENTRPKRLRDEGGK